MAILPASAADEIDHVALLTALKSLTKGDFSVRLPLSWTGMASKVADAFNDMVEMNERLASELERLSRVVGTEGKITQGDRLRHDRLLGGVHRLRERPHRRPRPSHPGDGA